MLEHTEDWSLAELVRAARLGRLSWLQLARELERRKRSASFDSLHRRMMDAP
jgi:hypothetical protein